jgi:hypothetical protein
VVVEYHLADAAVGGQVDDGQIEAASASPIAGMSRSSNGRSSTPAPRRLGLVSQSASSTASL